MIKRYLPFPKSAMAPMAVALLAETAIAQSPKLPIALDKAYPLTIDGKAVMVGKRVCGGDAKVEAMPARWLSHSGISR